MLPGSLALLVSSSILEHPCLSLCIQQMQEAAFSTDWHALTSPAFNSLAAPSADWMARNPANTRGGASFHPSAENYRN